MEQNENTPEENASASSLVPVLPLRDVVVYPHMVIPLFVGREKSIRALEVRWMTTSVFCWWRRKALKWMIRSRGYS